MEIDGLINRCRYTTGAYTQQSPYPVESLVKLVYEEIRRFTSEIETNVLPYKEITGYDYLAIYFKFVMQVAYKGKSYPVLGKVTLPPNFPLVPPIFSVINNDESRLQLNKNYINFLLPDRTYEVKLLAASYWKASLNIKQMVAELSACLSANFPFFQTPNPVKNNNYNLYYDPRYNDPNVNFPFDYNDIPGVSGNTTGGNYADTPYTQQPPSNVSHMQPTPPFRPQVSLSQGGVIKSQQTINEAVQKFKTELEMDLRVISESLEFLAEKQEALTAMESQAREKFKSLDAEIRQITAKNAQIIRLQDENSQKEITAESMQGLMEFGNVEEQKLMGLVSELKGLQETQIFLEEAFFEKTDPKIEQLIPRLNSLWRKEFDKKLALAMFQKGPGIY